MELMLEIISRQKFTLGTIASHVFSEAGGCIGRDEACEWTLPDKNKKLSRRHALITCDGTNFYIEDTSTNGIYLVMERERLPRNKPYRIEHGTSFYFVEYTVQARLLHKPDAYLAPAMSVEAAEMIPDDAFLDPDPLVAMEQQDEFIAKSRLGMYNDLLGVSNVEPVMQADNTLPPMDSMLRVSAIPEGWEDGDAGFTPAPQKSTPALPHESRVVKTLFPHKPIFEDEPERRVEVFPETDVFFKTLGFKEVPESPEERERILSQAAELLLVAVDGMLQALRNRADSKNDLRLPVTTMTLASNNPFKFSPNGQAALDYLLAPPQEGMLHPAQAMISGFTDLHGHHMGLLAGARAAVRAALDKVSPVQVEAKLEADGSPRFNRNGRLWNTFTHMHRRLIDDPESFSAFFLQDFARAYEVQVRTLHPTPNRTRRE